ncbi:MAG TPA: type I-E CRISPR-associated protein Cse2/CasB [Thiolinea sp.]|nr:type I-E CRISPR-associated protein Cse2/CasB [Thiolinea sp.]
MTEKKHAPPFWMVLKDEKQRTTLLHWYQELHGLDENNQPAAEKVPRRGERAQLKRCHSVEAAMMQQGFQGLSYRLQALDRHMEGLAVTAVLLALASRPVPGALPTLLGQARDSEKPLFSELRIQRLMAADSLDELLKNLRRAVMQTDRQANPLLLADSILHWEAEHRHPDWFTGQRRWQYRWAKDYYTEIFNHKAA